MESLHTHCRSIKSFSADNGEVQMTTCSHKKAMSDLEALTHRPRRLSRHASQP